MFFYLSELNLLGYDILVTISSVLLIIFFKYSHAYWLCHFTQNNCNFLSGFCPAIYVMASQKLLDCFVLHNYTLPPNYPKTFVNAIHYLPILTIPLVSLGFFCILKLSPPGMTPGYKALLLAYITW